MRHLGARIGGSVLVAAMVMATAATAAPDKVAGAPAPPDKPKAAVPLIGVTSIATVAPARGFVDDPIAVGVGGRIAYIETDGAERAEVVLLDQGEKARFSLPAATGVPLALAWVGTGDAARLFLVTRADDGRQRGVVYDLAGKAVRTFGPVSDVTLLTAGGPPRVALHRQSRGKSGVIRHEIELVDVDTGKSIGKGHALDVDGDGRAERLDFKVNHWLDGWTRAAGIHGGTWNKKEDQRSPDQYAEYDLMAGKFAAEAAIGDVVAHTRRMKVLAQQPNPGLFVRMSDDLATVELWRDGKPQAIELDQPVAQYDGASLSGVSEGPGRVWIGLKVDPVNRAAVSRKKADPEYLDLFLVDGNRAVRKARILAPKKRLRWGVNGDLVWVVERNVGFDRGGKSLTLYKLGA